MCILDNHNYTGLQSTRFRFCVFWLFRFATSNRRPLAKWTVFRCSLRSLLSLRPAKQFYSFNCPRRPHRPTSACCLRQRSRLSCCACSRTATTPVCSSIRTNTLNLSSASQRCSARRRLNPSVADRFGLELCRGLQSLNSSTPATSKRTLLLFASRTR